MAEAGKDAADAPHRNQRGHRTALLIIDMINCLANSMGASIDATAHLTLDGWLARLET